MEEVQWAQNCAKTQNLLKVSKKNKISSICTSQLPTRLVLETLLEEFIYMYRLCLFCYLANISFGYKYHDLGFIFLNSKQGPFVVYFIEYLSCERRGGRSSARPLLHRLQSTPHQLVACVRQNKRYQFFFGILDECNCMCALLHCKHRWPEKL